MNWWSVAFVICLCAFFPLGVYGRRNNPRRVNLFPSPHPVLGALAVVGSGLCVVIGLIALFVLIGYGK